MKIELGEVKSGTNPVKVRGVNCFSWLTARDGGSKLRSIGFMTIKTCWFLWVKPFGSRRAALQKYWTHPCFPKNVEGSPSGRPNLKGKLWIPGERITGPCPERQTRFDCHSNAKFSQKSFVGRLSYLALLEASFENRCNFLCRKFFRV